MSKAVLVMDMPDTCENCTRKYPSYKDDELYDCAITGKVIPINGGHYEDRPKWCPLRELPEKRDTRHPQTCYTNSYWTDEMNAGFNSCLDEILKECDADGNN